MNSAVPIPDLDPVTLQHVLLAARAQVATALWLSAGMLCAFSVIVALACGWRRVALGWALGYSLTLCFVASGPAHLLGPCGGAIALFGLLRPKGNGSLR